MLTLRPSAKVTMITSRKDARHRLDSMFPQPAWPLRSGIQRHRHRRPDHICDVVFYATPHGVAMADAPSSPPQASRSSTSRLTSASGIFRYLTKWYKLPHSCPDLAAKAAYGLVELNRDAIRNASIVGNPGCYLTTMQLGYYPLLKAGIIDTAHLIADCASGVSGAGKKGGHGPHLQ